MSLSGVRKYLIIILHTVMSNMLIRYSPCLKFQNINMEKSALLFTSIAGTLFFFPMLMEINPVKKIVDKAPEKSRPDIYNVLYLVGGSLSLYQFLRVIMK